MFIGFIEIIGLLDLVIIIKFPHHNKFWVRVMIRINFIISNENLVVAEALKRNYLISPDAQYAKRIYDDTNAHS